MGAKYDRQIDIINRLISVERTTFAQLALDFNVSVHTIKRDIAELSFHFPIITFQGKFGGVEISKAYALNGHIMKAHHIELIKTALSLYKNIANDSDISYLLQLLQNDVNKSKMN